MLSSFWELVTESSVASNRTTTDPISRWGGVHAEAFGRVRAPASDRTGRNGGRGERRQGSVPHGSCPWEVGVSGGGGGGALGPGGALVPVRATGRGIVRRDHAGGEGRGGIHGDDAGCLSGVSGGPAGRLRGSGCAAIRHVGHGLLATGGLHQPENFASSPLPASARASSPCARLVTAVVTVGHGCCHDWSRLLTRLVTAVVTVGHGWDGSIMAVTAHALGSRSASRPRV